MNAQRLQDRIAIVTGAAHGIGRAIAERYADEGARVVVTDLNGEGAESVASEIRERGGQALGLKVDVTKVDDIEAMFAATSEQFGDLDVLVNNAGDVTIVRHFLDSDEEWWDHFLDTNLKSQYRCGLRAARIMVERGSGCIINMSSGGATRSHRGMAAYDASKGGVEGLTRAMALELAPYGVRVCGLVPGLIATSPSQLEPAARSLRDETVPMGRGGSAEDLAGPAVFLASDDAAYVTGSMLVVDGGVLIQQRSPQVEPFDIVSERFPLPGK